VYPLGRAARRLAARGCAALSLSAIFLLAGCHNFFVCEGKASCPSSGGGGGSTTSDWVYVSNASAGTTSISAYDIGNGSLAAIAGSPYNIGFSPVAMVVSPSNAFLYAATTPNVGSPGIYMWTINSSTGAITVGNGGNVLISTQVASMDISPDGNFLFVVDTLGAGLTEYQIDTSTGLLSLASTFPIPPTLCPLTGTPLSQTCTVKVAPSGQFVVASLGSAGTIIYPYTSASGITSTNPMLIGSGSTTTNPTGDYSVTLDKNNFIYIARTAALAVYQITDAAGDAVLQSTATYSGTATPRSVALSFDQNYVYTANQGAGNISAYSIGGAGALTQVSGSPFTGPASISAIGTDKSGSYMVAVGFNGSSGLQLFTLGTSTVGTPGALTLTTSAGTGTSTTPIPAVLAFSH
jgi:6-phosphogluconolactonase (cycloisomerase 2 family)